MVFTHPNRVEVHQSWGGKGVMYPAQIIILADFSPIPLGMQIWMCSSVVGNTSYKELTLVP